MKQQENYKDPYRILFPLGVLSSIVATGFWVLFRLNVISFYPRIPHGNLMFFGFMWSFISGFLMTAIPRMTGTFRAFRWEIYTAVVLVLVQNGCLFSNEVWISPYVVLAQTLLLLFFLGRRFIVFKRIPFSGFIFIPLAFLMNLTGIALLFYSGSHQNFVLFSEEAFVLNLILGLGSRLIPVISRLPNALLPDQQAPLGQEGLYSKIAFAVLFNGSYIMQLNGLVNLALTLRSLLVIFAVVRYLRLFTKPTRWTAVGVGLKLSSLFLLVGTVLVIPSFQLQLAGAHILYIGGFALLTLLISTRVVLAHGGKSLDAEVSSKSIILFILSLVLSIIFRFSAGNSVSSVWIIFSVIFFVLAQTSWLVNFLRTEMDKKTARQ